MIQRQIRFGNINSRKSFRHFALGRLTTPLSLHSEDAKADLAGEKFIPRIVLLAS